MRFCSLLSGGKDSTYALHAAVKEGGEVACVASVVPRREDSWMFHRPLVELTRLQAESMGLADRHYMLEVSGNKEQEVDELVAGLRRLKESTGFDTLVIGGIASRYQLARFGRIASELGVRLYDPQWGADPEEYMRSLLREGIIYVITQITVYGLDPGLLGVPIDRAELVERIISLARKYGFHPAFEGGEAETFVVKAPLFRKPICLEAERVRVAEFDWRLRVRSAALCDEPRIVVAAAPVR